MWEFLVGAGVLLALKYLQGKMQQAPVAVPAAPLASGVTTPAGSVIAPAQGFSPATPSTASVPPVNTLQVVRNLYVVGDPSVTATGAGAQDDPVLGPVGLSLKPHVPSFEPSAVLASQRNRLLRT